LIQFKTSKAQLSLLQR